MKIAIAGCGNMGMIYARAFLKFESVSPDQLLLIEKNEERASELEKLNLGRVTDITDPDLSQCELLLLSIKPQDFSEFSNQIKGKLHPDLLILTIMAGITTQKICEALNHKPILRAMPNSPAALGMGITALFANEYVTMSALRKAENLLSPTGRTILLDNEDLMNAVTAVSGSGPAYFFFIAKNMIEAAKKMGLNDSHARLLVKQTMLGSYHLINQADQSLDSLISTVASKGGTTEAALTSFDNNQVGENIQLGLEQACARALELSKAQ